MGLRSIFLEYCHLLANHKLLRYNARGSRHRFFSIIRRILHMKDIRKYLAEFIGTFVLVFVACGVAGQTGGALA